MNSTKYGNDGGDCLRENAIVAKCNNLDCCDDEEARADEICEKRNCDCEKLDLSGFCMDICCEDDSMDIRNGVSSKEGCNSGHGLSAAIKIGTPEPQLLQSGFKLTCSHQSKTFVWHLIKKWLNQKRLQRKVSLRMFW